MIEKRENVAARENSSSLASRFLVVLFNSMLLSINRGIGFSQSDDDFIISAGNTFTTSPWILLRGKRMIRNETRNEFRPM